MRIRKRPTTLREVARRAQGGVQPFDPALREFLDAFYAEPELRRSALEERPEPIDPVHDAYLAATAEHLARSFGLPVPAWSEMHGHGLTRPYFAGGLESLKAILTAESPAAFRRRLLFVGKDALSRPHATATQRKATFTTS
jgi:hypothetical protein